MTALREWKVWGAFHSTKISGNSGSKSNGTEIFRKFVSKNFDSPLEVVLFWKFPVPFGISIRYESAPVPLVVKSYKMAASLSSQHYTDLHWMQMICHSSSLFVVETKSLGSDFQENIWTGRSEFPVVSSPGLHTLPREKVLSFSQKYQRRVEFWMRVKLLPMKQLNTALKTATLSRSFSILPSDSWWKMCSSGNSPFRGKIRHFESGANSSKARWVLPYVSF